MRGGCVCGIMLSNTVNGGLHREKTIALLILLSLLTGCVLSAASAASNSEKDPADVSIATLLSDLLTAYEANARIDADVEALDDDIARSVAAPLEKKCI